MQEELVKTALQPFLRSAGFEIELTYWPEKSCKVRRLLGLKLIKKQKRLQLVTKKTNLRRVVVEALGVPLRALAVH